MEMNNLKSEELDTLLDGAVLVRESRSGTTQDWRLQSGELVEIYFFKSGRIEATPITQENISLTFRY